MKRRFTITLSDKMRARLHEICQQDNKSAVAVIREALAIYSYILREIAKGNKLTIADEDDNIVTEIVLYEL